MLRPATPLTAMLFVAFALLLISVLSTPIIKAIPLASFGGISFGVFGYCRRDVCSKIEIGYNTANLGYSDPESATFNLPTSTRTTLSAILVVHPVACLFTLIMFVLAAAAHFRSPSHSPRYLLGVFILSIFTLLLSLLSFLIDLLLFVPHLAWGSYLVLAATILTAASGIVSCAMRRMVVSRKARAKRIVENAEMSGENFYNRQAAEAAAIRPSVPQIIGAQEADASQSFTALGPRPKTDGQMDGGRTSDERIPLTARTPTERSQDGSRRGLNGPVDDGIRAPPQARPGGSNGRGGGMNGGMNNGRLNPQRSRDDFGNVILPPPQAAITLGPPEVWGLDPLPPQDWTQNPYQNTSSRGRGGPPRVYRGRAGPYYAGGRGYNPNARGGYGAPAFVRAGMDNGPMGAPTPVGMGMGMRGGRGPPAGFGQPSYHRGPSPSAASVGYGGYRSAGGPNGPYGEEQRGIALPYGEADGGDLPRAESPPPLPGVDEIGPIGQAVEMDATTGSPSHAPLGFGSNAGGIRDSDSEVAGLVGLQQAKLERHHTVQSETSRYSNEESYVPPRQAWAEQEALGRLSPSIRSTRSTTNTPGPSNLRQNSGEDYYEDVEHRFNSPSPAPNNKAQTLPSSMSPPPSLMPGYSATGAIPSRGAANYLHPNSSNPNHVAGGPLFDGAGFYEDPHEGDRSPVESERSNFTSVSQRGVNPRWNGQNGPSGYANTATTSGRGPPPPPQSASQRNDLLLASNPDFVLPKTRWAGR